MKDCCPMNIRLSLSQNGQGLVITNMHLEHNHPLDEENFRTLPKQRKLDVNDRKIVEDMVSLRCNHKLVQGYIAAKTGKCVVLKDISNIKQTSENIAKNDLKIVVEKLGMNKNSTVTVVVNDENELIGIYYQDGNMKHFYSSYPEVILCVATYKLNNLRMPLYIIAVIDGNNNCEIVATFLLENETEESIKQMISIFKATNVCWDQTKTIITDKDFTERKVFAEEFPHANLVLCLFHTLKAFRKALTKSLGITSVEQEKARKIFQNIAYSMSNAQYDSNYRELLNLNLPEVTKYFNENWHPIRTEWVQGFKEKFVTFNTSTTNHLENINQKIKQVCRRYSNINSFYNDLLTEIKIQRSEKDYKARKICTRLPVSNFPKDSSGELYSRLLTPYAFKEIEKTFESYRTVKFSAETETFCIFYSCGEDLEVNENECRCLYFIDRQLPCKHILAYRTLKGMPLYDEKLVNKRYIKKHYCEVFLKKDPLLHTENSSVNMTEIESGSRYKTCISYQEKFKKAEHVQLIKQL
jgi:zinc finger SWIM domain-containing protein 3